MDNNTIYKLSLVALARKNQQEQKKIALELLKAIIANPKTDIKNTNEIEENLKELLELYNSIDISTAFHSIIQSDFDREDSYEIHKEYGVIDENESIVATMIDAWGLSILNLLQETVDKKEP